MVKFSDIAVAWKKCHLRLWTFILNQGKYSCTKLSPPLKNLDLWNCSLKRPFCKPSAHLAKHVLVYSITIINKNGHKLLRTHGFSSTILGILDTLAAANWELASQCMLFFNSNRFSGKYAVFHLETISQPTSKVGSHVTKFFSKECG